MAQPSSTRANSTLSVYPDMDIADDEFGFQKTRDREPSVNNNYQQGNSRFPFTVSHYNNANNANDANDNAHGYDRGNDRYNDNMDVPYVIRADFDGEMMQDALAIVQFPDIDISGKVDVKQWEDDVPILMDSWTRKTIPGPTFETGEDNEYLIYRILELHQRMLMYIQDYIRKATSRSLQQAYSDLSNLTQGETCISGQQLEEDFDLRELGDSGRKRLFWAFLRYELMSKIRLYKSVVDPFYIPPLELERRSGKLFTTWETEALFCVRTYSSILYQVFFAQLPGAELPDDVLSHDPLPARSKIPIQMVHLALEWAFESGEEMEDWLCVLTRLPNFGFGLITQLILSTEARLDYHELSRHIRAFAGNINRPCCCDEVHKGLSRNLPIRRIGEEMIPGLFMEIITHHGSYYRMPVAKVEMYRQRAWPFFNNARVHPQYSAFFPQSIAEPNVQQTHAGGEHQHLDQDERLPGRPRVNAPLYLRPGRAIPEFIRSRTQARTEERINGR
jgi:hypothetical protein